jgi:hypothetical protein
MSATISFSKSLIKAIVEAVRSQYDEYTSLSCVDKEDRSVDKVDDDERDTTESILTVFDFIQLIRMRYPADWACTDKDKHSLQCEEEDVAVTNNSTVKYKDKVENKEKEEEYEEYMKHHRWREKLVDRHHAFVQVFLRFLPATNAHNSTNNKTCTNSTTEEVESNDEIVRRDQAMVLAVKVLDFIEDIFHHMLPRPLHPHPSALGLVTLSHCLYLRT